MHRDQLIEAVRSVLTKSGFYVSKPLNVRGISFDIVARRDDALLIVKILSNIDAFSKENAEEMRILGEALDASPLLVGERSGSGDIEEGIVYSRFGVPIISPSTLSEFLLEGVPPFIFAAPGGLYVRLDRDLLKKLREEKNISLGTLAEIAGVSRRTIQMYESGMGAMIEVAIRLEEFLNQPIVMAVDPFAKQPKGQKIPVNIEKLDDLDIFTRDVFKSLSHIGFSIVPTNRCPFDALTKNDRFVFLTGLGKDETKLLEKARTVRDISRITERSSVIFIEKVKTRCSIEGTPLVGKDELKKIDGSDSLYDLVESRSEADEKD